MRTSRRYFSERCGRHRTGMSLVELMMSVSIAGLIAVGLQSSIVVAMRSIPNSQGSAQSTIRAGRYVDQLITELENAIYITENTATTLGFTLPDRSGDGVPERVRYAWTGIAGGPLTRQYNGGSVTTVASGVLLFNLTPNFTSVAESYTGLAGEDSFESLLISNTSGSGTSNKSVTSTALLGQYFTMTLPANVYAWRPTRVQFMARKSSSPAVTQVQIRSAYSNMTPTNMVLAEYSLLDTSMSSAYSWQSFDLPPLQTLSSGAGICLVLKRTSGSTSVIVQDNTGEGELAGTVQNLWTYSSSKSLSCELYGKLSRSGQPRSFNSNYLNSMGVSLQISSTAPVIQTTGVALNHPELLSSKWELLFDRNPTSVDMNGDATSDWSVRGGGSYSASQLAGGVWTTSGTTLQTAPDCDFNKTTVVDLRFQNTSVGGNGAVFCINALRSGSTCAPILVSLKLQGDGTQTLTLSRKVNDATTQSLISVPSLPNQAVDLHMIVDPVSSAVCIKVNEVERGTFNVNRFVSTDGSRTAMIGAEGSTAKFSYVRIRVLEQ